MASELSQKEESSSLPTPILTLKKSIARPFAPCDIPSLIAVANNPNVARYLRNIFPTPYTLKDAEDWITFCLSQPPESRNYFALIHPDTGCVIGGLTIRPDKDVHCRTAELGYWLGEEYWGQGFMSEAVSAFMDWIFENLKVKDKDGAEVGLMRVWAGMFDQNETSVMLVKKAGFEFEGRLRASVWKHGVVMDQLLYAMTRDDWEKRKSKH
jgi:ribosomal-protein-alanine N-acetyltransferase